MNENNAYELIFSEIYEQSAREGLSDEKQFEDILRSLNSDMCRRDPVLYGVYANQLYELMAGESEIFDKAWIEVSGMKKPDSKKTCEKRGSDGCYNGTAWALTDIGSHAPKPDYTLFLDRGEQGFDYRIFDCNFEKTAEGSIGFTGTSRDAAQKVVQKEGLHPDKAEQINREQADRQLYNAGQYIVVHNPISEDYSVIRKYGKESAAAFSDNPGDANKAMNRLNERASEKGEPLTKKEEVYAMLDAKPAEYTLDKAELSFIINKIMAYGYANYIDAENNICHLEFDYDMSEGDIKNVCIHRGDGDLTIPIGLPENRKKEIIALGRNDGTSPTLEYDADFLDNHVTCKKASVIGARAGNILVKAEVWVDAFLLPIMAEAVVFISEDGKAEVYSVTPYAAVLDSDSMEAKIAERAKDKCKAIGADCGTVSQATSATKSRG